MELSHLFMLVQMPIILSICILSFQARNIFRDKLFKYICIAWAINLTYIVVKFTCANAGLQLTRAQMLIPETIANISSTYCFLLGLLTFYKPGWAGESRLAQRIVFGVLFAAAGVIKILAGPPVEDSANPVLVQNLPYTLIDLIVLYHVAKAYKTFVDRFPKAVPLYIGALLYAYIQVLSSINTETMPFVDPMGFGLGLLSKFLILTGMSILLLNAVKEITAVQKDLAAAKAFSKKLNQILGRTFHELSPPLLEIETIASELLVHDGQDIENSINKRARRKIERIENAIHRLRTILTASSKMYESEAVAMGPPGTAIFGLPMPIEEEVNIHNLNTLIEIAIMNFKSARFEELTESHYVTNKVKFLTEYGAQCNVLCNSVEMVQVFFNLLKNSYEANENPEQPCCLFIKTKNIKEAQEGTGEEVNVRFIHRKILVEVEDNGPGIPEDLREEVFNQGFSTKAKTGRGFGLEIAKTYTEKNGGTIRIESPVESPRVDLDSTSPGTKFILLFPKQIS